MTRHREVLESDELAAVCPIFRDAERVIADPVVRNRGTVGGSLCQADPAEDLTTVCAVLDAVCVARGPSGSVRFRSTTSLTGPYETSLAHNEMLVEIRIPKRPNSSSAYAKVERRVGDWAVAAAGAAVTLDGGRSRPPASVSPRSTPTPRHCAAVSEVLVGEAPSEEVFAEAGRRAAARLRTGLRHAGQRRLQASPRRRTDHPNAADGGRARARPASNGRTSACR